MMKVKGKTGPVHVMNSHSFLTTALNKGGWSTSHPGSLDSGKEPPLPTE
jgi:hypothetical protein